MKKEIVWLVVSCLMALSLVMASCGTGVTEEEEEEEAVVEEEMEEEEEEEEKAVVEEEEERLLPPEVPKYGGTYVGIGADPMGFDPRMTMQILCNTILTCHDELLTGDWAKGPAGTDETDWLLGFLGRIDLLTGSLAESWELPDDETVIFNIRPGIHWALDPNNEASRLVGGREFTAEDVAWNIQGEWTTPTSSLFNFFGPSYRPTSVKAIDKYTVEIKVPPHAQGLHIFLNGDQLNMICPDVTEKYGDQKDWRNSVTVGPFLLADYVPGSQIIYKRNPDYYGYDPLNPENQLPYIDAVKHLVITDLSTQMAAFRTGKIDMIENVSWEDAELIMEQHTEFGNAKAYTAKQPYGRIDKEELPFKDVRVRQALNLAVNQQEILDDYYKGHGQVLGWPFYDMTSHKPFYTPLEELPEVVQELFEYHPDKARRLLAEAGYPDGFKTEIACSVKDTDFLSIIREYLLDVGVDMEIKSLETGVFNSLARGRKHEQMIFHSTQMRIFPYLMHEVRSDSADDVSFYENPRTRAAYDELNLYLGKDDAKWTKVVKDIVPFMLEEAIGIFMPAYEINVMWWPWLQNFHGEVNIGFFSPNKHLRYIWIDEALKKSMGY